MASMTDDGLRTLVGPCFHHSHLHLKIWGGNSYAGDPKILSQPLKEWQVRAAWATQTEQGLMNILETLEGQYDAAKDLWGKYDAKLKDFRAMVKNDIASLEASGRSAFVAVNKIRDAHNKTIEVMNSADMVQAIANAERLATALERIQALKSHKLTLAVLDASPKEAAE
jgi:hypothetical protein